MTAVRLQEVFLAFGDRFILKGAEFSASVGEVVAITGDNGCGKTTLLRVAATLLRPNRGRVSLFGGDIQADLFGYRRRIGALFVSSLLSDDLTVYENLLLYARLYGLPSPETAARERLESVGLTSFSSSPVRSLSFGERQRVSLARSLLNEPELWILDEPTTGLDDKGLEILSSLLITGKKRRCAVIATHNAPWIQNVADRALRLEKGTLR